MAEFKEVMNKRQEICDYYENCNNCPLFVENNSKKRNCSVYTNKYPEEAEKTIMEWQKPVDWSKVAVDTKVLVSDNGIDWIPRYFAEYKDNKAYTFFKGRTSWSNQGVPYKSWKYVKLVEKVEE